MWIISSKPHLFYGTRIHKLPDRWQYAVYNSAHIHQLLNILKERKNWSSDGNLFKQPITSVMNISQERGKTRRTSQKRTWNYTVNCAKCCWCFFFFARVKNTRAKKKIITEESDCWFSGLGEKQTVLVGGGQNCPSFPSLWKSRLAYHFSTVAVHINKLGQITGLQHRCCLRWLENAAW